MTKSKVIIFCRHFGGYGGEENHMMCLVDTFKEYETHVFVQKTLKGFGLLPTTRRNLFVEKYEPKRFLRFLNKNHHDVFLFIRSSADPFKAEPKVFRSLSRYGFPKAIIPAGNCVSRVSQHFDYIFWQSDNADDYGMGDNPKNRVMYPPAMHPANMHVQDIPFGVQKSYVLSVFNNYNRELKGNDLIDSIAEELPLPLVWCSDEPVGEYTRHNNVIHVHVSRRILLNFFRHCKAYLSFSNSEGFGWSVFEAMIHGKPVISRPIGIARDFRTQIRTYENRSELVNHLHAVQEGEIVDYDLEAYTSDTYLSRLNLILAGRTPSLAPASNGA